MLLTMGVADCIKGAEVPAGTTLPKDQDELRIAHLRVITVDAATLQACRDYLQKADGEYRLCSMLNSDPLLMCS